MSKNLEDLSRNEKKFIKNLLNGGNKTDTEIARETDMSVSTVNRIRHRFEEKNIIEEYIPIFNLEGVNIQVYGFFIFNDDVSDVLNEIDQGHIIFSGNTSSINQKRVFLLGFESHELYQEFISGLRGSLGDEVEVLLSEMVSEPDEKNFVIRRGG